MVSKNVTNHPGIHRSHCQSDPPLTFHAHPSSQVKTTQPRRYLVRPNQGLIKHGQSEEVTIILVDKEKQILLNEFEQIGPGAIESSKDKFLIQSKVVEEEFYESTKSNATAKEVRGWGGRGGKRVNGRSEAKREIQPCTMLPVSFRLLYTMLTCLLTRPPLSSRMYSRQCGARPQPTRPLFPIKSSR